MPVEKDPRTGRLRWVPGSLIPSADRGGDDTPLLDFPEVSEPEPGDDDGGWRQYVPAAIRGLSALVPGGPWGAAAGLVGEGAAQAIEGDLNIPQLAAQTGLGFIPFGRTAGALRTGAKAAAHGALGGGGTALAEQVEEHGADLGKYDLGEIKSGAQFGGLIGGGAGTGGHYALRRFMGGGRADTPSEIRLKETPGEVSAPSASRVPYRGPLEARDPGPETPLGQLLETPQAAAARASQLPGGGDIPSSRVPYRPATPPIKHKGGVRGDMPEEEFTDIRLESPTDAAARLGTRPPAPATPPPAPVNPLAEPANPLVGTRFPAAVSSDPDNPLARMARLDEAQRLRTSDTGWEDVPLDDVAEAASSAAGSGSPLGRFLRITAPEFSDIQQGRTRLVDKTAGLPIPAGMRDQIDRMGLEYRRTQAALRDLRATPNADLREVQRMEQAARELGSRLSGMEREAVRLAKTQVPVVSGGGGAPDVPGAPGREGHFTLPETRVPDEQYSAIRRLLGIEESPLATAERRGADVGSPTGVERRNPVSPEFRAVGDEAGFWTPELATGLGTGVIGAGIGAAVDENTGRGATLGALLGLGAPYAYRNPHTLERLRVASLLSGPGTFARMGIGNIGSMNLNALERAIASGDPGLMVRVNRELFSAETPAAIKRSFMDPTAQHAQRLGVDIPKEGVLSLPGRAAGALDAGVRDAAIRAGFSPEDAARITFTNDPESGFSRGVRDFVRQSPLARLLAPFTKTALNIGERGWERMPFRLDRLAKADTPAARRLVGTQLGLGGLATLLGAEYGDRNPYLTALAGPYALPFAAGIGASRGIDAAGDFHPGQAIEGAFSAVTDELPLMSPYSLRTVKDPGHLLGSFVPNLLRELNPDLELRDTAESPLFGPALAKTPFLSETLPSKGRKP